MAAFPGSRERQFRLIKPYHSALPDVSVQSKSLLLVLIPAFVIAEAVPSMSQHTLLLKLRQEMEHSTNHTVQHCSALPEAK